MMTREAGSLAVQFGMGQAVDHITNGGSGSGAIPGLPSGPISQTLSSMATTAAQGHIALMTGDPIGVATATYHQLGNQLHLAQAVTSGLLTAGGGGNAGGSMLNSRVAVGSVGVGAGVRDSEPRAQIVYSVAEGSVGEPSVGGAPSMTHADTVAASTASQQQIAVIAAIAPTLTVQAVPPTQLPVNTSHDTVSALQARTPMDPVGPAVTQGAPQPIMQIANAYQAHEVEPQRVYNQDHAPVLPPVTLLQTDQSQLRILSDPLPPQQPQPPQPPQSSGSSTIIVIGTVAIGGVLIFLWYIASPLLGLDC